MKIRIRYNIQVITILMSLVLIFAYSCSISGTNNSKHARAILEAEKPSVDSARVPEMIELYRSKRYEDLQTAEAEGIEKVLKISFHGRQMGNLSPRIADFIYLATLDLSYNDLADLPDELSTLHYLQGFYVRGNKLTVFPEQILLLPLLARLDLSENQITEIPPAIIKMDQLVSLNLEKNALNHFPVQLFELSNLSVLNLAHNGCSSLPEGIGNMLNLEKLDLSNNQLTSLPGEIILLSGNLKELSINGNQIPADKISWLEESMPSTQIRY